MGSIPGYGTNIPHVVGNHSHVLQWSTSELQLRSDVAKLKKKKKNERKKVVTVMDTLINLIEIIS